VCALEVARAGRHVRVLEAAGEPGGRARSTVRDGCTFDHGFQVLFTAYPTLAAYLDFPALALRKFRPAAHVVSRKNAVLIGDALSDKSLLMDVVAARSIGLTDKLRLLNLRRHAMELTIDECFAPQYANISTRALLAQRGFATAVINGFFAPFYGGILLDRTLSTSAAILMFTFKMLSEGDTVIPAGGMGAMARQMAQRLPAGTLRTGACVTSVTLRDARATGVTLDDGHHIDASDVVLATDAPTTARLAATCGVHVDAGLSGVGSTSLYFTASRAPLTGKSLWLNDDPNAVIGHAVTPVALWRVPYSQFAQPPGFTAAGPVIASDVRGLWRASELQHSSSLEGAARGGRAAAAALLTAAPGTTP
jgi:protoporphyrinogen oxidase